MTDITIRSNGSAEGNSFVQLFNQIERDWNSREAAWLDEIRPRVALVHPDDGWVDRTMNTIHPVYPQHRRVVIRPGDVIVLGHHDKWREVTCTGFHRLPLGGVRYSFREDA